MKKIPVKIIEFSDGDRMVQEVMIDLIDTMQLEGDPGEQIEDFRNSYFDFVKKVKTLFYGSEQSKKKKRQTLPSSVYYRVGELFQKFNNEIKNRFEITNYTEAISRDFGLSIDYHYDISTIVQVFKKNQIIDSVPFSYYRALKRKRSDLEKSDLFQKEIKRLNKMGLENALPGREKYKLELIEIIKKSSTSL
ncbi:MAG: hypothetical protein HOD60_03750 [Candidatus Nitrosopelagicus sp.]|jgi:hypothetical protein|nr:hypothetical protein [Candidatus Nitrosopelagicus sp.]